MSADKLPPLSARRSVTGHANASYEQIDEDGPETAQKDQPIALGSAEALENTSGAPPAAATQAKTKISPASNIELTKPPQSLHGKGKVGIEKHNGRKSVSRSQTVYDDSQSEDDNPPPVAAGLWGGLGKSLQSVPSNREQYQVNDRFKNYSQCFNNLTKCRNVPTKFPLVSVMITYNSKLIITVTKENDTIYYVKMYDLSTYKLCFEERVGCPDSYIKLKEVEQNQTGDFFAIAYVNDGNFRVRTFDENQRDDYEEILAGELDVNHQIEINNFTMPVDNFPDPFINCTFLKNDLLFVCLNHNHSGMHHMFVYNYVSGAVTSKQQVQMEWNPENFPYKCFYSIEENEVYSFYRQGQGFRVPIFEIENRKNEGKKPYEYEQILEREFGEMYLINERALVVRSSSQILFFKQETDPFSFETTWENYAALNYRANSIYWIKGNKRIQITTDKNIYIYLIDPITFEPTLENVIKNFMNCTQMLFGNKVRYGITFKTNEKSFDVWQRKYYHNYSATVVNKNLEGSLGLPMEHIDSFLVSNVNEIKIYDLRTYIEIEESVITIPLEKSTTREPNEIISMVGSPCNKHLVVISGQNLAMNEQQANQLFVFELCKGDNDESLHDDFFRQVHQIKIRDVPGLERFSMQFKFKNGEESVLIFATRTQIFEFNYVTKVLKTVVVFKESLSRQPEFFLTNTRQNISIIASPDDGIYYNHTSGVMIDLDQKFQISNIKEMIFDEEDGVFYIMANKYKEKLGLYLIRFDEFDPDNSSFFLKFTNKLSIGDADIVINHGIHEVTGNHYKELIVSYKTIYMNTYSIQVFDIQNKEDILAIFDLKTFQLWESKTTGFFALEKNDFIIVNSQGITIVEMGTSQLRALRDDQGQEHQLHSLESSNYLKVDIRNFITFEFSTENKVLSVIQQFKTINPKTSETEDDFETVYKINVSDITLRELFLMQGLYVCRTPSDILQMVKEQPMPTVFFKTFLEFNGTNIACIVTFDSKAMKWLLSDSHSSLFDEKFPLFYKNKIPKSNNNKKYYYRTAIDSALKHNQIRAVQCIVDYIISYQNNYTSSFLFEKNCCELMEKGIKMQSLLDSSIFSVPLDFDQWPANHECDDQQLMPYSGSYFNLRYSYGAIFPDYPVHDYEITGDEDEGLGQRGKKSFKIKYKVNLLPVIDEYVVEDSEGNKEYVNEGNSFIDACCETEEIEVFDVESFQQYLDFKWDTFARSKQLTGFYFHLFNMASLVIYTYLIYIVDFAQGTARLTFEYLLIFGVVYPSYYDFMQMYKSGISDYFSEGGNYFDMLYIISCIANVIMQKFEDSQAIHVKIVMTMIFLMQIYKTFFFLQIFETISYIVTMIFNVFSDLKQFMFFFAIKIFLFSQIFSVLGLANHRIIDYPEAGRPNAFRAFAEYAERQPENEGPDMPGEEYAALNSIWLSNIMNVLRVSLGDFDFAAIDFLTVEENTLFWVIWFLIVLFSNIIFLNFIIAEASASYETVKEKLNAEIYKSRAKLVSEAQFMTFKTSKDCKMMPQFIIVREADT